MTTSGLALLGARGIPSIWKRFRKKQIERAADLLDVRITENSYDIDLLRSTMMIYNIWNRLDNSITYNCWLQNGLILEDPVEYASFDWQDTARYNSSCSSEVTFDSYFLIKMIATRKISKVHSLFENFLIHDYCIRRRTILLSHVNSTSSTFKGSRIKICDRCS